MSEFSREIVLTDKPVEFDTHSLIGGPLDWAMSVAMGVAVKISASGQCWFADKPRQMYSPHTRFRQGGRLLDVYDVQLITGPITGGRVANIGEFYCTGPDTLIAMCRVIVMKFLGPKVAIPHELAQAFLIHEPERVVVTEDE